MTKVKEQRGSGHPTPPVAVAKVNIRKREKKQLTPASGDSSRKVGLGKVSQKQIKYLKVNCTADHVTPDKTG